MAPEDFAFLARLLRRRSGLALAPDRMVLVERRLAPVMDRFGFRDVDGLIHELRLGQLALAEAVTEAMTVNDSSFFRDPAVMQRFRDQVLPRFLDGRRLRIWSAGCAAGQEAYSIGIILAEMGLRGVELIATDLCAGAIDRAQAGRYAPCEIERGLDMATRDRWFRRDGKHWVADDFLRRNIVFRRFNLLDSFGWLDDIGIVFCRNVLMYLDPASRQGVLDHIAEILSPDGVLLLGESDMPDSLGPQFELLPGGPGIYGKTRIAMLRAG